MLRSPRVLCVAALAAACALPNDPLSGIEVSWSLTEREDSDGEGAARMRTCAGALLRWVEVTVEDLDDASRQRTFTYGCETGYQTQSELATLPSKIYVDLREGTYRVTARAVAERDGATYEVPIDDALEVSEAGVARLHAALSPALAPWDLVVDGGDACEVAAGLLRYLDPADDLVEDEEEDGDDAENALYRTALTSAGGLVLDGRDEPCAGLWSAPQRFMLDPGRYRLELRRDGASCAIPLEVGLAGATTTLDLAKLPCDG